MTQHFTDATSVSHLLAQTLKGSCGSEKDTSEMLLAGPGQVREE